MQAVEETDVGNLSREEVLASINKIPLKERTFISVIDDGKFVGVRDVKANTLYTHIDYKGKRKGTSIAQHPSQDEVLEYFVIKKYDDLVTVGVDGTRNGSVRVIKSEFVRMNNVSRRVGSLQDDCTNIHNKEDLKIATERLLHKNA